MAANSSAKSAFHYTSKLALKIARAERAKPIDTHGFVAKILATAMGTAGLTLDEKEQSWSVRYVHDLERCALDVLEVTTQQQNALVTCLIRHRLPGMTEWSPEDTTNLPSELCEEIYKFALLEKDRGNLTDPSQVTDETEELLGKSKTEATKTTSRSTGQPSTTNSESSTPETPTSVAKDSDG